MKIIDNSDSDFKEKMNKTMKSISNLVDKKIPFYARKFAAKSEVKIEDLKKKHKTHFYKETLTILKSDTENVLNFLSKREYQNNDFPSYQLIQRIFQD